MLTRQLPCRNCLWQREEAPSAGCLEVASTLSHLLLPLRPGDPLTCSDRQIRDTFITAARFLSPLWSGVTSAHTDPTFHQRSSPGPVDPGPRWAARLSASKQAAGQTSERCDAKHRARHQRDERAKAPSLGSADVDDFQTSTVR